MEELIGRIEVDGKYRGTGFLVNYDIVMTAKHNILLADELVNGELGEKDVLFCLSETDKIKGKTINLCEAIDKRIDCVFIKLDEIACKKKRSLLIPQNNCIYAECKIIGYSKVVGKKSTITGKVIVSNNETMIVSIKKEDQLHDYEGISGSPVLILDNVIGIAIKQTSDEEIIVLPVSMIKEKLNTGYFTIKKREINIDCSRENISMQLLNDKAKEIISIAGPRYSSILNVKTKTLDDLKFILKRDAVMKYISETGKKLEECAKNLNDFDFHNKNDGEIVSNENRRIIQKLVGDIRNIVYKFENIDNDNNNLSSVPVDIKEIIDGLNDVFEIEKEEFEKRNGKGTYNNKHWRGLKASYMCSFPAQYLDEIRDVINSLNAILQNLDIKLLESANGNLVLVIGKGGIGKTHLLCDIANQYLKRGYPSVILTADLLNENENICDSIVKWLNSNGTIDSIFAWLNEYGIRNDIYIPICIDAINEISNAGYWKKNIPILIAKIKKYSNLKVILSCRSIYLSEYLDESLVNQMTILNHQGFYGVEYKALKDFGEYYGVNIDYRTICTPEFLNPLCFKMLCEIAQDTDDKTLVINDIKTLMEEFFQKKNKIITNHYKDFLSVRDEIVQKSLKAIAEYMINKGNEYIEWLNLRSVIRRILSEYDIVNYTSGFIKKLISENLLKEVDDGTNNISFAYQKFFEYMHSLKYEKATFEDIEKEVISGKISKGTLEMITINYFNQYGTELLSNVSDSSQYKDIFIDSFISSLYWRKKEEVNNKTNTEILRLMISSEEKNVKKIIIGLIIISTKIDFPYNAYYIHNKLSNLYKLKRDYILSFFLLKRYDSILALKELCERAISLQDKKLYSKEQILLWEIILGWGCGATDIKLRDNSSKGLVNLMRIYPESMLPILKLFHNIDDDYIHERIWQSICTNLVFLSQKDITIKIQEYIKEKYIQKNRWPQNVLIRDYIRNIFEYGYYKKWISETEVTLVRPPYKSKKHVVNRKKTDSKKVKFERLYWNCQNSDFVYYTIPYEVVDYGLSKEEVGLMIFEDIIKIGYNEVIEDYDAYLDQKYGSLRARDSQIERIGKKYQKIYLYREMGNIYDNYVFNPKMKTSDIHLVPCEQGISFREIDLSILKVEIKFEGTTLVYPFYRYEKWNDDKWYNNNDIFKYILPILTCEYENNEYLMLQGYLHDSEKKDVPYRRVWMQVRTYLFRKDKRNNLTKWLQNKSFEGRWMPEGFGQLYECSLGEYPWSPTMINYLGQEVEQEYCKNMPCKIIPTVNDYVNEKDSQFFKNEKKSYMFPAKYLYEKMCLCWDNSCNYISENQIVIRNARNNTIFIKKDFLIKFLNENNLDIFWTILGEKEIISGISANGHYSGRSEFSYSYFLDDDSNLVQNHEVYDIVPGKIYNK